MIGAVTATGGVETSRSQSAATGAQPTLIIRPPAETRPGAHDTTGFRRIPAEGTGEISIPAVIQPTGPAEIRPADTHFTPSRRPMSRKLPSRPRPTHPTRASHGCARSRTRTSTTARSRAKRRPPPATTAAHRGHPLPGAHRPAPPPASASRPGAPPGSPYSALLRRTAPPRRVHPADRAIQRPGLEPRPPVPRPGAVRPADRAIHRPRAESAAWASRRRRRNSVPTSTIHTTDSAVPPSISTITPRTGSAASPGSSVRRPNSTTPPRCNDRRRPSITASTNRIRSARSRRTDTVAARHLSPRIRPRRSSTIRRARPRPGSTWVRRTRTPTTTNRPAPTVITPTATRPTIPDTVPIPPMAPTRRMVPIRPGRTRIRVADDRSCCRYWSASSAWWYWRSPVRSAGA